MAKKKLTHCNKTRGTTLHSLETDKYIYDDSWWSERELVDRYECSVTGKPCVGRFITKIKCKEKEQRYYVQLNKEIQHRCPLYHLNSRGLIVEIQRNSEKGKDEELERKLNAHYLKRYKREKNKK